jgi:hypothetical protein
MKRMATLWLGGALMAALALSAAAAQNSTPLGDYARQVRKQKAGAPPAVKTFDNDNIPKSDTLSVVGPEQPADSAGQPSDDNAAADSNSAAQPKLTPGQDLEAKDEAAEKQKMYKEWQKKIQDQRDKVDLASRELDVTNREYRLRAAAFYADAGNRLRNSAAWDKEDAKYKDQIATKEKTLDEAKHGLDDMQEQARKAGVPSSMRE